MLSVFVFVSIAVIVSVTHGLLYDPSEQNLVPIDTVRNTEYLFTGIPYRLKSGCLYWAWNSVDKLFSLSNHSLNDNSVFYFVLHSLGYGNTGYYNLRNPATGIENLVIKCNATTNSTENSAECYMMPATGILQNVIHGYDPILSLYNLSRHSGNFRQNHYILVPSLPVTGNQINYVFRYDKTVLTKKILSFDFEVICQTSRQIIEINLTTRPVLVRNDIFNKTKYEWRETIINPTNVSKVKTIKESMTVKTTKEVKFSVTTNTKKFGSIEKVTKTEGVATPPVTKATDGVTLHGGGDMLDITSNETQTNSENTTEIETQEIITIPAFTCVEILLATEDGENTKQNFTAKMRVSAKITRFDTANGLPINGHSAPGMAIPQFLRDQEAPAGDLIDVQQHSAIYQDDGEISTTNDIKTKFFVQELPCRNANPHDAYGNVKLQSQ